ncbi:hypothetical protein EON64_03335, partial [archaeon]
MDSLEKELVAQLSLLTRDYPAAAAAFCRSWGFNATRQQIIRKRNVFLKTWRGTKRIPVSPFALIQDEFRKVEADVVVAAEDLEAFTSEAERGFELLLLFIQDLLGRQTAAARIFMLKSDLEFEVFHGSSWQLKVLIVLLVISLDGFFIYYAILKGFSKGLSWQADYVKAWSLQVSMDVVLFETIKCLWFHVVMPRMAAKEVQAAYHTVQDTVCKLFETDKRSNVPYKVCFNSTDYFFVSTRVAHKHKSLVESMVVRSYTNHLPGPVALQWQKQVDMLYEKPQTMWQRICAQFTCSVMLVISLPLVPLHIFQSAALSTIVRAPLAVQSVIIRMIEPLLLYACTFSFLMLKDDPLLLGVAVCAAALMIGGLVWDSVRANSSSIHQLAADSGQQPLAGLLDEGGGDGGDG